MSRNGTLDPFSSRAGMGWFGVLALWVFGFRFVSGVWFWLDGRYPICVFGIHDLSVNLCFS